MDQDKLKILWAEAHEKITEVPYIQKELDSLKYQRLFCIIVMWMIVLSLALVIKFAQSWVNISIVFSPLAFIGIIFYMIKLENKEFPARDKYKYMLSIMQFLYVGERTDMEQNPKDLFERIIEDFEKDIQKILGITKPRE